MSTLILGNGVTHMPKFMDDFDTVVCMNNYKYDRCDIWVNNLVYKKEPQPFPEVNQLLRLYPNYKNKVPSNWKKKCTYWDDESYARLVVAYGLERPSTGMMAIRYFIEKGHVLSLAGFNFVGLDVHDWEREAEIVESLCDLGKIDYIWR